MRFSNEAADEVMTTPSDRLRPTTTRAPQRGGALARAGGDGEAGVSG
ncbi:MAG: hypothetical protein ACJ741_15330 [Pyrinomonadaceae bacterium]